jgi:PTS system nitrogen regulatory IIA component
MLSTELTKIPLVSTTKEGVILELLELLKDAGKIETTQPVFQDIMSREKLMSTGIGHGLAIPHGKTAATQDMLCAFGTKPDGVDFDSIDGQPADIFFLIVSPEDDPGRHLKFLAMISHVLKNEENRRRIRAFSSPQDAMAFFTMVSNSTGAASVKRSEDELSA